MTNVGNADDIWYNNTFISSIKCSDHYPNHDELICIQTTKTDGKNNIMEYWKINNMNKQNVNEYKYDR